MKRIALLLLTLVFLAGCGGARPADRPELLSIGITQIVEHPSLDTVRAGIIAGLEEEGFREGIEIEIDFHSAQGEQPIAQQIAQKFVMDRKDLIIALSTPSAQAAAQATQEIPIIFGTVTDPVGAGLVESWERPGGNVTGTSDLTPVREQLSLFERLGTGVRRVGVIYNAGESNSVTTVALTKEAAAELGLEIVEATVANASEVQQAAQSLVGRVDGLYLITDNTLAQGVMAVIDVANSNKIPAISSVDSYVNQGALATFGLDYYRHGLLTAEVVVDILEGKNPGDLPVRYNEDLSLIINTKTVETLGLDIPAAVLEEAQKIGD